MAATVTQTSHVAKLCHDVLFTENGDVRIWLTLQVVDLSANKT